MNEVVAQAGLALSAIHAMEDMLFKTIGRIAAHPDVYLKYEEIEEAISMDGLTKLGFIICSF